MAECNHHDKACHRQQGGRLVDVAQADQCGRISHNYACAFECNQCQEEADTCGNRHFQAHRQRVDQHFTHFKEAEQDKNDAGNENGTQSHTPVHAHAFDDGKGEVGVQAHAWRKGDRVVADKTHHETADGGGDTGGHKYCAHIHACFAQNQGVDDDDVAHGEEGGQTGHDFSADVGLIGTQVEQSFQNALI